MFEHHRACTVLGWTRSLIFLITNAFKFSGVIDAEEWKIPSLCWVCRGYSMRSISYSSSIQSYIHFGLTCLLMYFITSNKSLGSCCWHLLGEFCKKEIGQILLKQHQEYYQCVMRALSMLAEALDISQGRSSLRWAWEGSFAVSFKLTCSMHLSKWSS